MSTAAVVGAGTMGVGIAHALASGGYETIVVEPSADRRTAARELLETVADGSVERGKATRDEARHVLGRVLLVPSVEGVPRGCEIVVESVPERFELKRDVLRDLESRRPLLLTTNTSALSVDELAATLERPERFLGTHFFNPVWSLALVEVVLGEHTAPQALSAAREMVARIGKEVAVVRDSPGFATSRLDLVAALESMRMVEQGVAEPADIDRAMVTAYRHPVGPLRLSDIVGLDVRLDIARGLHRELGERFAPPAILERMVADGHLGKKSGRGFYDWG